MKVGLIGVGNMGGPLLRKLLNNHHYQVSVLLENNNPSKYPCKVFTNSQLEEFI